MSRSQSAVNDERGEREREATEIETVRNSNFQPYDRSCACKWGGQHRVIRVCVHAINYCLYYYMHISYK